MKSRFVILLVSATALLASLHAQEKDREKAKKAEAQAPILIFQPSSTQANASNLPDGIKQLVATFFVSLQKREVDAAYALLTKGSMIAEKPEELKQLKAKTQEAIEVFGAIEGYDLVEAKSVGNRLVRSTFASHGKVFPLRWRFYFYKPEDVWRLIDMRVDDKLSGMFDEPEEPKSTAEKP
jgi:hypothetical protein